MAAGEDYLEGIVKAMSRVGNLIVTMGLISGLILVVLYVENFAFNGELYSSARFIRDEMSDSVEMLTDRIKAIDLYEALQRPRTIQYQMLSFYCRERDVKKFDECKDGLVAELSLKQVIGGTDEQSALFLNRMKPSCIGAGDLQQCRKELIGLRSIKDNQIKRLDNERQLVNLGRVKLPFLGYELAANDAPVVLGFFLVIFASLTLITVHHLKRVFSDADIWPKVKESLVLLRAKTVLIYAPTNRGFIALLTKASFYMPCFVMLIATLNVAKAFLRPGSLLHQNVYEAAILQICILLSITVFLSYVGLFLTRGWTEIGRALHGEGEEAASYIGLSPIS